MGDKGRDRRRVYMPLKKGNSKEAFEYNLTKLMREGYDKDQALAISYNQKKKKGSKKGK